MAELRERLQARENDNARESKRREKTQKELQDVRSKFDEEMRIEEQIRSTYISFSSTTSINHSYTSGHKKRHLLQTDQ